jgi:hypothetical protein
VSTWNTPTWVIGGSTTAGIRRSSGQGLAAGEGVLEQAAQEDGGRVGQGVGGAAVLNQAEQRGDGAEGVLAAGLGVGGEARGQRGEGRDDVDRRAGLGAGGEQADVDGVAEGSQVVEAGGGEAVAPGLGGGFGVGDPAGVGLGGGVEDEGEVGEVALRVDGEDGDAVEGEVFQ